MLRSTPTSSPVIATLQSPYDVRKRVSCTTPAMISQSMAENAGSSSATVTQQSPQFRAAVPPIIRSPLLAHQPSPTIKSSPGSAAKPATAPMFRNSTTALGTKRWSITSPANSPFLGAALSPVMQSQAMPTQCSPALVLRCYPAATGMTPPMQKLSPMLMPARAVASPSARPSVAAAFQASLPTAAQSVAATAATETEFVLIEDDFDFALPPPEVDLEDLVRNQAEPLSGDGSDADSDSPDLARCDKDDSLVRSPCGTRVVKATKEYSLDQSYSIWFQHAQHAKKRPKSEAQYQEGLQCIGTFNSVQDFWRYWNAIDLSKLPNFSTLSVFKGSIKPMWEDPHNTNGGEWVMRCVDRVQTADFFTKLALALIGGYFDCHEDLCGVVLTMKPKFNSLSLWNCQVEPAWFEPTEYELRELLCLENGGSSLVVEYKEHGAAIITNANKQKHAPEAEGCEGGPPRLTAKPSLTGPVSLAPSWLVRPGRPDTMAATDEPSPATVDGSSSASTMKANAATFTPGGGYTGYAAGAAGAADYQYTQAGAAPGTNGTQQYGNYFGGDYAYYGAADYSATGAAYYPAAAQESTSNEWG